MRVDTLTAHELRHHYLLCALDDAQRARLLATAEARTFGAAEILFRRGDAARRSAPYFCVLCPGYFRAILRSSGGVRRARALR